MRKGIYLLITIATFGISTALAKSGSEMLADALKQEKELRSNASPFSNSPDFRNVIAIYTQALDSGTLSKNEKIRALLKRGGLYTEQGECKSAVPDLDSAIEMGHRSALAYALRSACRVETQAYDAAVEDLNKAIALSPKDAILRRERALVFLKMKDFERAAADLGGAIQLLKPKESADLHTLRGDAHQQRGEHQRAINDYLAAVRIRQNNAKELGVPATGAQMVQVKALYGKIAESYRALSMAPERSLK
jgi:tetratricopeptide (TPR) repeat protein